MPSCAPPPPSKTPTPTRLDLAALPQRRLAGFYFFYFAWIGAFAPFFSVYLDAAGLSPVEIGVVMALPAVTRIVAPHLWGWLADASGRQVRLARAAVLAGTVCWLGLFASTAFLWIAAVVLAAGFFLSAALPLIEATTLTHLGRETGRYGAIRLWGSIGYIVAVLGVGYALDFYPVRALLWIVAAALLGTLAFSIVVPDTREPEAGTARQPIGEILLQPTVIALIVACALMAVAHGPYYTFYSIHLVDHGYSKGLTGWLWALGVFAEIAIFMWLPRLYAAFTLRGILVASFALAAVRFFAIGWGVESLVVLLLAQALHAASFGSFHAAAIGIIHQLFGGGNQARGQAIYGSLTFGVGGTLGALASGALWDFAGPGITFSAAAVCALAGMLLVLWKVRPDARERTLS